MTPSDPKEPVGIHGECWNLLPWIANESAATKDVARIEEHLRHCRECQAELDFQRQLRDAIRSEEAIVLAPQTSLQKVLQRIDAAAIADDDHEAASAARPRAKRRERPAWSRWLSIAAAVQGIAIAGLLAAVWSLTAGRYTVLTTPTPAVASGPVIRVVFAGDVELDDMNRVLRSIDAQIVGGPSEAGVYTLRLTHGAADERTIGKAVAQLRADGSVKFAEWHPRYP